MLFFTRPLLREERAGEAELRKRNTLTSCCLQRKLKSQLQQIGKQKVSDHPKSRSVCLDTFTKNIEGREQVEQLNSLGGAAGVWIAIVLFPGNLHFYKGEIQMFLHKMYTEEGQPCYFDN